MVRVVVRGVPEALPFPVKDDGLNEKKPPTGGDGQAGVPVVTAVRFTVQSPALPL